MLFVRKLDRLPQTALHSCRARVGGSTIVKTGRSVQDFQSFDLGLNRGLEYFIASIYPLVYSG